MSIQSQPILEARGRMLAVMATLLGLALAGCSDSSDNSNNFGGGGGGGPVEPLTDRAYYILPPGNYGGLPTTENSLDQLPLYDGLTPLRDNVSDADIEQLYLPQDFQPIGETREEATGRPGVSIIYDEFGIAHITGETREDMVFGAGWVTMRDRSLLVDFGRWPARVAVADVPGIDAFELVLSGQTFVPSPETEQLVTDQVALLVEEFGEEGQQIVDELQAYADGMNAYEAANGIDNPQPYTVNDGIAVTAFIGSIFGAGGGSEASNSDFLAQLIDGLGDGPGQMAWEDVMLFGDPEAPTTIDERFDYGPLTGGAVTGSVVIDEGSIISLDPRQPGAASSSIAGDVLIPAAQAPRDREASNWLLADGPRTANGTHMGVLGPQLGYYYPEIVMQLHLRGPGVDAQGIAVTGLSLYLLIGRTADYAWSLTSAGHDVRDVYVELLCEPDGSEPTRDSLNYLYDGECTPYEITDAGTLNGIPLIYPTSVHGNVIGTATVDGDPVALTRKRSTFGRDGLNLAALKDLTEGDAGTPETFFESANKFGFTFNWGYVSRDNIAFFSSGLLPERPPGLDRRLPTLGTGEYEWTGFLTQEQHPHGTDGPDGLLLNWNNQAAPGFMHGDGNPYGSVHRVETFDQWPDQVELTDLVGVMNRSATEDVRSPVWPVISEVLRGGDAPSELAASVIDLLDDWVAEDSPRLDADDDGFNDHSGPTIIDELFEPLARAVMSPVFGSLTDALDDRRNLNGDDGASFMDKDLRTLLGKEVDGPFNVRYCGNGDLETCRDSLWAVVESVSQELAVEYGGAPDTWLKEGARSGYAPGLINETHRSTNRPTFQQVLQFVPASSADGTP